jgi:hypothetical protein
MVTYMMRDVGCARLAGDDVEGAKSSGARRSSFVERRTAAVSVVSRFRYLALRASR